MMNPEEISSNAETIARVLYYACALALLMLFIGGGIFRSRMGDRVRLWLTCATGALIPTLLLTAMYAQHGGENMQKGYRAPGLYKQVENLDTYLESDLRRNRPSKPFSLAVLGDSTHYYALTPEQEFAPQFRQAFPEIMRPKIEIYGLRHLGLDAYDFYFLTNYLTGQKPDMILMPVNLRSFGPGWLDSDGLHFPALERYTQWREIPRATYLSSDARAIRWDLVAMRKLDFAFSNSRNSRFLQGTKLVFEERLQEQFELFEAQFSDRATYVPASWLDGKQRFFENKKRAYPKNVASGHSMIKAFRAINRLAYDHGIEVVYYSVESNRRDVRQQENFKVIQEALLRDPGVHFIDTLGLVEHAHFLAGEHLTPEGINLLSRYLANQTGMLIQEELGLTDVVFDTIEKNDYREANPGDEPEKGLLKTVLDNIEAMSADDLEEALQEMEPRFRANTIKIWERKNGPRPSLNP